MGNMGNSIVFIGSYGVTCRAVWRGVTGNIGKARWFPAFDFLAAALAIVHIHWRSKPLKAAQDGADTLCVYLGKLDQGKAETARKEIPRRYLGAVHEIARNRLIPGIHLNPCRLLFC